MTYGYAEANPGSGGPKFAKDTIGGVEYPLSKAVYGAEGEFIAVTDSTPMPVQDVKVGDLLRRVLQVLLAPLGFDKSLQRYRQTAIIESGTVTTVTTVTGLTNINGFNGDMLVRAQINAAWALGVRARIT